MAQAPCPCSKGAGATGVGPHLPNPKALWATPAPSCPSAQCRAGPVAGSETTFGLCPEFIAQSSATSGLGVVPGPWGTLHHPGSAGFGPCPPVPSSRWPGPAGPCRSIPRPLPRLSPPRCLPPSAGRGAPAAPRYRSLALGAPGFAVPQLQGSTLAVPGQPDPLPPSSPPPSFG